eukprot:3817689-Rhodomonas_salina.1
MLEGEALELVARNHELVDLLVEPARAPRRQVRDHRYKRDPPHPAPHLWPAKTQRNCRVSAKFRVRGTRQ